MAGSNSIGSLHGIPIRGTIRKVDLQRGIAQVSFPLTQLNTLYPVKIPAGWVGPRGEISCGYPSRGTNIFCELSQGNEWVFLNYDQSTTGGLYDGDGRRRVSYFNKLKEGRWLTLVENDIGLIVDKKDGVIAGDSSYNIHADPSLNILSSRFNTYMSFTESKREISGPLMRDLIPNSTRGVSSSSLYGHQYNRELTKIGLDPRSAVSISGNNITTARNPGLAENREIFYEFVNSFNFTNDPEEESIYAGGDFPTTKSFQRKNSRTDNLSLGLDFPNYLLEVIIGTAVDIYGNILDLNRSSIPNGTIDSLSFRNSEDDNDIVFKKLREQLRKSIAYHFELNARKAKESLPDYTDYTNYSRDRSRFSFDIDKEGQFKLNVPGSSEVGNIPLLVRHENFSNIKGAEEDGDRGTFIRNATDNIDVQLEPYGKGIIELKSNEDSLKSFAAPKSRVDNEVIKLGTAYHDISNVLQLHKFEKPYEGNGGYLDSLLNYVDPVGDVVSTEIITSGEGANAGGRSGTISLDGFLSMSIGANTVDRQSLWLDCAGGVVAAVGRDRFQRSVSATLDGDLFMQIGGDTVNDDSRFPSESFSNTVRDGVVDIRVWNALGTFHTIRIDSRGIKIHTPQRLDIVSEGDMRLKSVNGNMSFDAENITFYPSSRSPRLVTRRGTTIG